MLPYITQWLWNSEKSPEKEQDDGFEILDNQPFNKEDDWVLIEKSSPSEPYTRVGTVLSEVTYLRLLKNDILFILLYDKVKDTLFQPPRKTRTLYQTLENLGLSLHLPV